MENIYLSDSGFLIKNHRDHMEVAHFSSTEIDQLTYDPMSDKSILQP